jgi:hypothetical protein
MDGDEVGATIIQFPMLRTERRVPSIEAVQAMAPSRSLMEALVDDVGLDRRDVARGFGREFAYLARAIEVGGGSDDATFRLRHLVDAQVLHAMELCEVFCESASLLMELEIAAARSERISGTAQRSLRLARMEFRNRAVAAGAAAEAALGAVEALAGHVRQAAGLASTCEPKSEQLQLFAAAV